MSTIGVNTTEEIHRAVQYISCAGIHYLEQKEDDSHTNLGWDFKRSAFISRKLNDDALYLALNMNSFRLEFIRNDMVLASKPVAGSKHLDLLHWLNEVFRDLGFSSSLKFKFHYDLPYAPIHEEFVYENPDAEDLKREIEMREKALKILGNFKDKFNDISEIRTWPHHFDTAVLLNLDNDLSVGMGLAIPDSLHHDHYFYLSAWKGNSMVEVKDFPDLRLGTWKNESWKGGILDANHTDKNILEFLESGLKSYLQ